MNANLDVDLLKYLQDLIVKAEGRQSIRLSPTNTLLISPDGHTTEIKEEPPSPVSALLSIDDVLRVFNNYQNSAIYISKNWIYVIHNNTNRLEGFSRIILKINPVFDNIKIDGLKTLSPSDFEKIAKVIFGADDAFIHCIRSLQWSNKTDTNVKLSTVDKSLSIEELASVLDQRGIKFENVVLKIKVPFIVFPFKTKEVEVPVDVIANAGEHTISYGVRPGIIQDIEIDAIHEIREMVINAGNFDPETADNVFLGYPYNLTVCDED